MKRPSRARPLTRYYLILGGLLALLLPLGASPPSSAQFNCTPPPLDSDGGPWKQGATVQVNIDPAYNTDQRNAIKAAFENWNAARVLNCSGVTFAPPTFSSTPIAGPTINPSTTVFKYQIYKQNPPNSPSDRGFTGAIVNQTLGHQVSAWSYLNVSVTVPEALKQLTAHEIGHSFTLDECTFCGGTASVMNGPVPGYNDTGD